MELSIANRGDKNILVPNVKNEDKHVDVTIEESMVVNSTLLKSSFKEKDKKTEKRQEYERRRLTLKEMQEKVYPFSDSDVLDMLEQLLKASLILKDQKRCKKNR